MPLRKPLQPDDFSAAERVEFERLRIDQQIRDALREALKAPLADLNEKLDRIEAQTTATNGRVRVLEIWKARNIGLAGGISAVVTILGYLLSSFLPFLHK